MAARAPRLVVVDDDAALAEELAGLFTDVGYEVAGTANTAKEGLELVRETRPDVVVMDIRMAGMSGTEAAKVLRNEHPALPVVLLSAYSDPGFVAAGAAADVAAYLVKGCSAGELLATVEEVVRDAQRRNSPARAEAGPAEAEPAGAGPAEAGPS